jgi:CubicO group peptidase (beta-lactamase class C family)
MSISTSHIGRRRLIGLSGLAAAGLPRARGSDSGNHDDLPPDARPGGAFDRYVAGLAAAGQFSGVVLLSHRGRTVLSRAYGWADRERGVPNRTSTAFGLSSAGKPFHAVAILQLAQQGRLQLNDPIGRHLTGFAADVAERVTVHQLLTGTSGLDTRPRACGGSSTAGTRCTRTTSGGPGRRGWWVCPGRRRPSIRRPK